MTGASILLVLLVAIAVIGVSVGVIRGRRAPMLGVISPKAWRGSFALGLLGMGLMAVIFGIATNAWAPVAYAVGAVLALLAIITVLAMLLGRRRP